MTQTEFINRMAGRWPGGFNDYVRDDLQSWLMRNNVEGNRLDSLYTAVAEQYKYQGFPALNVLAGCLGGAYDNKDFSQYQTKYCIEQTQHLSLDKLMYRVDAIRNAGTMIASEVLFVGTWGELNHIRGHLKDLRWEQPRIKAYLERIKESITAGEEIKFNVETINKDINIDGERTGKTKSFAEVTGTLYFQD